MTLYVVWHEGIAGRKAEEVAAAFIKALKAERDCKHIVLWLDNCSAQNKNQCLFATLISWIHYTEIKAKDKTHMSNDLFHHGVEQQIRRQHGGNVYDSTDFCDVIQIKWWIG